MKIATENSFDLSLVKELNKCGTWQAVNTVFESHYIDDHQIRINYLCFCMGNPRVFYGGKEKDDTKEELYSKYMTMLSMFITGSWR